MLTTMGVRISDKEIAALIRCAEAGLNQGEAAEITLLSPTTVHRASVQFGIKFHTFRENDNARRKRDNKSSKATKQAAETDAQGQRAKRQAEPKNANRGGLSPCEFNSKKARAGRAVDELKKAKTVSQRKEILIGFNMIEHEIEMARLGRRPQLPMDLREYQSPTSRDEAKQKAMVVAERKRQMIFSCFKKGEDLTAADVGVKIDMAAEEMSVQTISSFLDGMSKQGRLLRYRLPQVKGDRNYWYYFLP